ncbi:MAG: Rieske (2Fe-2S) protein [Proteobacteria bacterium]|nr:Rieske (2Fe-2S) protein [Pseudomonadota bacterium]
MARREQEHHTLPIPNGWFAVGWSRELQTGDVKPLRAFGQDWVLFRTRSGQARVLDAYCPHLGAHLGEGGRVVAESLRCPFHGWQFDGESGRCTAIPYCERIPDAARVGALPTQEKNGMVFAWHHAQDKPPDWDFPVLPEIGDPEWSEPRTFELEVPVHVQDMHENNNDPAHFQFVHGMLNVPESSVSIDDDGRTMHMQHTSDQDTPLGRFRTTLSRVSWGLGLASVRSTGIPGAGLLLYSSTLPIEAELSVSRWLLTTTLNIVDIVGEEFMNGVTQGVMQDLPIWSHKVHRRAPVLCEADTHLAEFRRWAAQFYCRPEPAAANPEDA